MKIKALMIRPVKISVGDTVPVAALRMREHGIGFLPVMNRDPIVGTITDRDVTIAHVAMGGSDRETVREIMSLPPVTCTEDASVEEAAIIMGDNQVRRLPVTDANGQLVGIISVDDIAENYAEHLAGETLGEIVEYR